MMRMRMTRDCNYGTLGTQACAACKYQRRKCSIDCPLAPYFPPKRSREFLNVHKLFGVSNVLRILKRVHPSTKADTINSIIYEAEAWGRDPIYGCVGIILFLQVQVEHLRLELEFVRNQISLVERNIFIQDKSKLYDEQQYYPDLIDVVCCATPSTTNENVYLQKDRIKYNHGVLHEWNDDCMKMEFDSTKTQPYICGAPCGLGSTRL